MYSVRPSVRFHVRWRWLHLVWYKLSPQGRGRYSHGKSATCEEMTDTNIKWKTNKKLERPVHPNISVDEHQRTQTISTQKNKNSHYLFSYIETETHIILRLDIECYRDSFTKWYMNIFSISSLFSIGKWLTTRLFMSNLSFMEFWFTSKLHSVKNRCIENKMKLCFYKRHFLSLILGDEKRGSDLNHIYFRHLNH